MRASPSTGPVRVSLLFVGLWMSMAAQAQLSKWLVRDMQGVHLVDLTAPTPVVGPLIPGFGSGGMEDVNLMTDADNDVLFCLAVDNVGAIQVRDGGLNVMPHGNGLIGSTSSLQSAICPVPCHADRYFIVHEETASDALYYSRVDMVLNGGLGDVAIANIPLGSGFSEALAISHQMPTGCRWLFSSIAHGDRSFDLVKCLISASGIGPPTPIATVNTLGNAVNYKIELSPDNTRLAMSLYTTDQADPDIVLWDLDLATGTVDHEQQLSVSDDPIVGLQFSPGQGYLYYLGNAPVGAVDFGRVELSTLTPQVIEPAMGHFLTTVELAGNGRIYVAMNFDRTSMAQVAFPDAASVAGIGYDHDAVFISAAGCQPSLPNAIEGERPGSTTTPAYIDFSAQYTGNCGIHQFQDSTCLATWWEWDFGDGRRSNAPTPVHAFNAGTYDITLRVVACGDTLQRTRNAYITSTNVVPVATGTASPQALCAGGTVNFSGTAQDADSIAWRFGDGTGTHEAAPSHVYTATGTYDALLVAYSPCWNDTLHFTLQVAGAPGLLALAMDTCARTVHLANTSPAGGSSQWSFGDGHSATGVQVDHSYGGDGPWTIQLITGSGTACADTVHRTITFPRSPDASFTSVLDTCSSRWYFEALDPGTAVLRWAFSDGASSTDRSPMHVFATRGQHSALLTATSSAGCITQRGRLLQDLVSSADSLVLPNVFTPNGDGVNDRFRIGDELGCGGIPFTVYDRWGQVVFDSPFGIAWDGRVAGRPAPEGVYIVVGRPTTGRMNGTLTLFR